MTSETSRHLELDGCYNARDLGGLRTTDGRTTRWGALVRADGLDGLGAQAWDRLVDYGVRTVIDLRNEDEYRPHAASRPKAITTIRLPLDNNGDREFWRIWESGPQFGTPLYYQPHIERFPERSARVITAIANAPPGGVLFHCGAGRDRAGQIAMLTLALADVTAEDIAADYELSHDRLTRRSRALDQPDESDPLSAFLASRGTTASEVIIATLGSLDIQATLRDGGLTDPDLHALRLRLLEARRPPANGGNILT
jgi:protein-tyrosine phosphatase